MRRFWAAMLAAVFMSGVLIANSTAPTMVSAAPTDANANPGTFSGVSRPKILGKTAVGKTLTAHPDANTSPTTTTLELQWLRGSAVINGATASTYVLAAPDRGKRISIKICYIKTGYTTKCITSSKTKKVAYGQFAGVSKPTVGGTAQVGSILVANLDSNTSPTATSLTYQWYRNNTKISAATRPKYTVVKSDQGRAISVNVCYKASGYATKCATSSRTGKVKTAPTTPGITIAPGTVWAWGQNGRGQLGDGTTKYRDSPVQVRGMTDVASVSTTHGLPTWESSTYAVKQDGTAWAWGDNTQGQLDGVLTDSPLGTLQKQPVQMAGLTGVKAIDVNYCARALKTDGTVWEWGAGCNLVPGGYGTAVVGGFGQFPDLSGITAISADVALKSDGTVWFFTDNNQDPKYQGPQYTDPRWGTTILILPLSGLTGVTAIGGDYQGYQLSGSNESGWHAEPVGSGYALKADGTVWAWGSNSDGQLGDGTTIDRSAPVQVTGLTDVIAIGQYWNSAFALRKDGTVWGWGANENYNLGDGTDTNRTRPVQIPELTEVSAISPPLAVKKDGTVWGWGCMVNCGVSKPKRMFGLSGAASVAVASGSFYALGGK